METPDLNPQNIKIYLLPGLGADKRIFGRLPKLEGIDWEPLDWIDPGKLRTAKEYANLLHAHYKLSPPFILGGVSLGGIVAREWARLVKPQALIQISTLDARREMPPLVRASGNLGTHHLMGKKILVGLGKILDRFTFKSPEGRALFVDMLEKSSPEFLRFGAEATFSWKGEAVEVPVLRIHGDRDMVFPLSRVKKAEVIRGGNHYMIYEKAEEIAALIGDFVHRELSPAHRA